MPIKELKIKNQLEMAVEDDLEEEIKDGIYGLALKLHRLYQHKKERALKLETYGQKGVGKKTVSEVNINIKMEGGATIEIKEIKRESGRVRGHLVPIPARGKMAHYASSHGGRFDWTRSLRSGFQTLNVYKGIECPNGIKMEVNGKGHRKNIRPINGRLNDLGTKTALLELGWKY